MARTSGRIYQQVFLLRKQKTFQSFKFESFTEIDKIYPLKTDKFFAMEIDFQQEKDEQETTNRGFIVVYIKTYYKYKVSKDIAIQFQQLIKDNIRFKLKQYAKAFEESLFQFRTLLNSTEYLQSREKNDNNFSFKAVLYLNGQLFISKNFQSEFTHNALRTFIKANAEIHLIKEKFKESERYDGVYYGQDEGEDYEEEKDSEQEEEVVVNEDDEMIKSEGQQKRKQEQLLNLKQKKESQYVTIVDPNISQNIQKLIITNRKGDITFLDEDFEKKYPKIKNTHVLRDFVITFQRQDNKKSENESSQ